MPVVGLGLLSRGLRAGLGVGVAGDLERQRDPRVGPGVADGQLPQVEGVEDQLDAAPGQAGIDLVRSAPA